MADSNMTISAKTGATVGGKRTRLNKVTFTQTAAGAAGNATTSFAITGTLLRVNITGGDAVWNVVLNDGTANIWSSPAMDNTAKSFPMYQTAASGVVVDDDSNFAYGIPLVEQKLLCTISNGGTLAGVITVIWEDSEIV